MNNQPSIDIQYKIANAHMTIQETQDFYQSQIIDKQKTLRD